MDEKKTEQLSDPRDEAAVKADDPGGAHAKGYSADPPQDAKQKQPDETPVKVAE